MKSTRTVITGALIALAAVTAACGGGGHGSSLPAQNGALASGSALLTIPNATAATSSTARKAQFVSASAASVGVTVNGGTPTYTSVAASSALCSTGASGRTCTIPLSAPAGSITFVFTLYDGANGAGNTLGAGTATQTVVIGTPFTVNVAVGGAVASIAVSVPVIDVGPTSVPVTVTAKDADGNTIIGSTPYTTPITLTNSDTSGTTTLSTTTVTSPSTAVTLTYTGGALKAGTSISVAATGVPASASSPAAVSASNYFPVGLSRTFAYTTSSSSNFTQIGAASPMPSSTPAVTTGTYTESIASGATFNGVSGAQATTLVFSSGTQITALTPSGAGSTTYQSIANGNVTFLGQTGSPSCPNAMSTSGSTYATLPFAGGTSSTSLAFTATTTYALSCGLGYALTIASAASNGNFTQSFSTTDTSSENTTSNANGTGTDAFSAGSGTCSGAWQSGLPCTMSSAVATAAAPAASSVTISVSQKTSSGTQTGSVTIPVGALYPNGVPTAAFMFTSTVGAAISAPPKPCAVTAAFTGAVVPVTTVLTVWSSPTANLGTTTEVDYLAPSVGKICVTKTFVSSTPLYVNAGAFIYGVFAYLPLPLRVPDYLASTTSTETDSLVSTGPPLQGGTATTTGNARTLSPTIGAPLR